jgi:hypothetical protein
MAHNHSRAFMPTTGRQASQDSSSLLSLSVWQSLGFVVLIFVFADSPSTSNLLEPVLTVNHCTSSLTYST